MGEFVCSVSPSSVKHDRFDKFKLKLSQVENETRWGKADDQECHHSQFASSSKQGWLLHVGGVQDT